MANIPRLVERTREIKRDSDQSVGWKLAAMKAVEAQGIRYKPDVKRLSEQVMAELRKCGDVASGSRRRVTRRSVGGRR